MSKRRSLAELSNNLTDDEEVHAPKRPCTSQSGPATAKKHQLNFSQGDTQLTDVKNKPGIVQSITLKNFMCHDNLEFTFCPNVNIITGLNGSGKSAILTGIVLGLGGSAANTNRGKTVKSFIKVGRNDSTITINLRNTSTDAYKPDIYGKMITIIRKMTNGGNSSYTIKSAAGKVISNKKEELTHILDSFNIQVDNPISIMNQETSKSFLNNATPSCLYNFFLKATQLDKNREFLRNAQVQIMKADVDMESKKQSIKEMEAEVKDLEEKCKRLQNLDTLEDRLIVLRQEAAWAQVVEYEKGRDILRRKVEKVEAHLPEVVGKVNDAKATLNGLRDRKKELETELEKITKEASTMVPRIQEAAEEKKNALMIFKQCRASYLQVKNELEGYFKDKNELEEKIDELRNSNRNDVQDERERRMAALADLKEQRNAELSRKKTNDEHLSNLELAVTELRNLGTAAQNEIRALERTIADRKRTIVQVEASKTDKLRRFGQFAPQLKEKIEAAFNRKLFQQKPRGPLGAYIEVKDQRWILAVEQHLKGTLASYLCDNFDDMKQLQSIMKDVVRNGQWPTIICQKFVPQLYDTRSHEVKSRQYSSILQMLEIEDPVVANCLIDQAGIESVLLIPDNKQCRNLMRNNPPQNCNQAYTLEGDNVYPAPGFRSYPPVWKQPRFLQENVETHIAELQQELNNQQQRFNTLISQDKENREQLNKNVAEYKHQEMVTGKIQRTINQISIQIRDLENVEEPESIDVSALEEELNDIKRRIGMFEVHIQSAKEELHKAELKREEADRKAQELEESSQTVTCQKMDPIKGELDRMEAKMDVQKQAVQHNQKLLKEFKEELEKRKKMYEIEREKAEELEKKVIKKCARVKVEKSAREIMAEIENIENQMDREQEMIGDRETLENKFLNKSEAFGRLRATIKGIEEILQDLKRKMEERENSYVFFLKVLTLRTKLLFATTLNIRSVKGQLHFDHKKEALDFEVQNNKELKNLSGGERSFSTISFILSLWDTTDAPFRMLDEFDVFMDMCNRRVSMELLIEITKEKSGSQFFFLTPLGLDSIKPNEKLRKFRMQGPVRGLSQAGPSSQQDEED